MSDGGQRVSMRAIIEELIRNSDSRRGRTLAVTDYELYTGIV